MSWSFPIGHLFGSELRVHATFFLLLAWIGIAAYLDGGALSAAANIVFVLALFACVVAHEFGHALMARRFGIRTPDVTLLPIGGLARLERMPEKPGQEIAVALAGPAVNVVIFALLTLVIGRSGATALEGDSLNSITFATLPLQLASVNLILAIFNLIPAFPMDGGRVLRALLSIFMERTAATRAAASAGQVFAFAMGLYGLIAGNPMMLLIAFFVFMAAGAESSDTQMRALARGLMARDAMITEFESLRPDDSIDTAASALIRTTQQEFPVIEPISGQLEGVLTRDALFHALNHDTRPHNVAEIMTRDIPRARLTDGLEKILEQMQGPVPAVAVLGPEDRTIGYVNRDNIGELMVLANAKRRA